MTDVHRRPASVRRTGLGFVAEQSEWWVNPSGQLVGRRVASRWFKSQRLAEKHAQRLNDRDKDERA